MFEVILYVAIVMPNTDVHKFEPASWVTDAAHMQKAFDSCAEAERFYMMVPGYVESDCYYVSPEKE